MQSAPGYNHPRDVSVLRLLSEVSMCTVLKSWPTKAALFFNCGIFCYIPPPDRHLGWTGVSQSQLTLPSDFQLLIKGQSPKKCLISPYWKQRTASSVVEGGGSPTCSFPWEPSPIHRSGASSAVFGFLSQAKRPASASSMPQLRFSIALVWISGNWGKACRFPCELYKNWEC